MNHNIETFPCGASKNRVFPGVFLLGLAVCFWNQWGPQSHVVWDANCVVAFTFAGAQIVLLSLGFYVMPGWWRASTARLSAFFAINLGICLVEFQCGVPYYTFGWIFWLFLGMMLVYLPMSAALAIGVVASLLYAPFQAMWKNLGGLSLWNWFNLIYPLAFPWILGLVIRQMLDSNRERATLIADLQAAKCALEEAQGREIELATLRERERLARDLHDTLGHQLATMTVQLEAAQRLATADPARLQGLLGDMQKLSRESMGELRRSLDNLRMSGLGDRKLSEALQALCVEYGRNFGLTVDCRLDAGADSLPPRVAEALWRVAQEGLTNISQHAQARRVDVRLAIQPREIRFTVADNGVGWPPGAENKPGHYGLRGLRERVEGLGGTFTLAAVPDGGAGLEVRIPRVA